MNQDEASELLVVIATFDQRRVDDADPEHWAWALSGVSLDAAKQAVIRHYGATHRRIVPVDILGLVGEAGDGERGPCGFRNCHCTHEPPCDHGWIEHSGGVRPCPTCRPEQARIVAGSASRPPGPGQLEELRGRGRGR